MQTILAIDVGNTRAKFGLFEVDSATMPQVLSITAVPHSRGTNLATELEMWVDEHLEMLPRGGIVSGSNPLLRNDLLDHWPFPDLPLTLIRNHNDIPLRMNVDQPVKVGVDRLLTAYAARGMVSEAQAVIVIDSGTATTVNLTTSDDTFQGGGILPGLRLSAHALHDYTARLPLVDTDQLATAVSNTDVLLPGRNTIAAMKSGLFWGQLGAVRELSARLSEFAEREYGESLNPAIFLTGGGGRQLVNFLPDATYIDSLTLHGLSMLASGTSE